MNIGVLFTCYNCEDYVDACITPWLNLREEYNFIIACNSGMFKDYLDLDLRPYEKLETSFHQAHHIINYYSLMMKAFSNQKLFTSN